MRKIFEVTRSHSLSIGTSEFPSEKNSLLEGIFPQKKLTFRREFPLKQLPFRTEFPSKKLHLEGTFPRQNNLLEGNFSSEKITV